MEEGRLLNGREVSLGGEAQSDSPVPAWELSCSCRVLDVSHIRPTLYLAQIAIGRDRLPRYES